jgi:hypothetical protein
LPGTGDLDGRSSPIDAVPVADRQRHCRSCTKKEVVVDQSVVLRPDATVQENTP